MPTGSSLLRTPQSAGHDRFPADLVEEHLGPIREALGLSPDNFLGLGRVNPNDRSEPFCMTVLVLRLSRRANAVSALHGHVSRRMWAGLWPRRDEGTVPIGHITNGVHALSWLAPPMQELYDRHLSPNWKWCGGEPDVWEGIDRVDDAELWETHQSLKGRLLAFVRCWAALQCEPCGGAGSRGAGPPRPQSRDADHRLCPPFCHVQGRATLILNNLPRLASLINDPQRPMQLVFAGKAHPRDGEGKQLLCRSAVCSATPCSPAASSLWRITISMWAATWCFRGAHVWLNTPRRPHEASGTSGQKAVLNGGLNLSVLDGWWAEAFDGSNGFAIGHGETHAARDPGSA